MNIQGREDLRLDERLMQLLRYSNAVLRGSRVSVFRQLHVRTFGVTPLGPRTGLIEWVEHSVPLFGLYQNSLRHSMAAAAATGELSLALHLIKPPTEELPALLICGISSQLLLHQCSFLFHHLK